jgi:predicted AlkP superfamily phosphohydrolase/phosphomutase
MNPSRVVIIGLDSVAPALAFDQYRNEMPNLRALCDGGCYGPMRSTDPPITIPAWISMTSGRSPGQLGIYGFRHYTASNQPELVSSTDVHFPRIWDLAAEAGMKSVVVSVPGTYPLSPRPQVIMTTDFTTPSARSRWIAKPSLRQELTSLFGPYIVDVANFRNDDTSRVSAECAALTRQHFGIFRHLIQKEQPRFAMLVDIAPDRLHHAALHRIWLDHPAFENNAPGLEYYRLLDDEIGKTLAQLDSDTLVMVVSDHGVKPLCGGICLNEILIRSKHLVLADSYPDKPVPLNGLNIDWKQTTAFAHGGYVGRVFFNRMKEMSAGDMQRLGEELKNVLKMAGMRNGEALQHQIFSPGELYGAAAGTPPDFTVYLDNLNYRAIGSVGHGAIQIPGNDQGPDRANHDLFGIFAANIKGSTLRTSFNICDVFASAVRALGIAPPDGTAGESIL